MLNTSHYIEKIRNFMQEEEEEDIVIPSEDADVITEEMLNQTSDTADQYCAKGMKEFEARRYKEAACYFLEASKRGQIEAQYMVGKCFYEGKGVSKNATKALYYATMAADLEHPEAQILCGRIYMDPSSVGHDYVKAQQWLERAAKADHAEAHYWLGILAEKESAVTNRILDHYMSAARGGFGLAWYRLGCIYCDGVLVNKNAVVGKEFLLRAAAMNIAPAMTRLAKLCEDANEPAAFWLLKAIKAGGILDVLHYLGYLVRWTFRKGSDWIHGSTSPETEEKPPRRIHDSIHRIKAKLEGEV